MASYFSNYPKLLYNSQIITDILTRVSIRQDYSDKVDLYYSYELQENDTPEIVAYKYYGDPEYHWIILLINNIADGFFDLPLSYIKFNDYLNKKYQSEGEAIGRSGLEYCKITLNPEPFRYRTYITTIDGISNTTTTEMYYIDEKAYNDDYGNFIFSFDSMTTQEGSLTYTQRKEIVYIYDYEYEKNENKRKINLLRKEFVPQIERELKSSLELRYV